METGNAILFIGILVLIVFVLFWLRRKFKTINFPSVFFVSGAVKAGKSFLSVHLAIKEYKKAVRWWKIKRFLRLCIFPFKFKDGYKKVAEYLELDGDIIIDDDIKDLLPPMLYSNIPLAKVKYNLLTIDILMRQTRIPNKSVCLIDEASLVADSMLFKDDDINNALMSFYKLYGHYCHGGKCIIDSQSMKDNHFSVRRCIGSYLWIKDRKVFPFISILSVREMIYADDSSITNTFNEDIELSLRKVIVFNSTYKKYDCYCYSCFTDYLPVKVCYTKDIKSPKDDLKCYCVVSLNDYVKEMNKSLEEYLKELKDDEKVEN